MFSYETTPCLHEMAEREPVSIAFTVESGYHSGSLKDQDAEISCAEPEWHSLGISVVKSLAV